MSCPVLCPQHGALKGGQEEGKKHFCSAGQSGQGIRAYYPVTVSDKMGDELNFRALLIQLQDGLSDRDRHRLHFLLGDLIPADLRDDLTMGGTLNLLQNLLNRNKQIEGVDVTAGVDEEEGQLSTPSITIEEITQVLKLNAIAKISNGNGMMNGKLLTQQDCSGTKNQQWEDFLGALRNSYSRICLDLPADDTNKTGAHIQQWDCTTRLRFH
ncbi:hypothetical protein I4U23_021611 [Adineta vaga]|nr:hypothetical protein I4U23_021611 [Adineta vaga]